MSIVIPSRNVTATFTWIAFIVLTLTWGSSFILIKKGLQSYSPWQVATLRLVSAATVMFPLAMRYIKQIPKDKLGYVVLSSLLSMFFPAYLFCAGQTGISSSIVGVLNALTPICTFVISKFFFHQKAKWTQVTGLLVGLAGTSFLILFNAAGSITLNWYAILIVTAALCYGLNINIIKTHLFTLNPMHLTTATVSIAGLLAFLYALVTDTQLMLPLTEQGQGSFIAVIILGVMGTAFAQIIFNTIIKNSSTLFSSSVTYFVPIIAIVRGVWDGETLYIWQYMGIMLIIASVLLVNRRK